jgi:hypothetical protein
MEQDKSRWTGGHREDIHLFAIEQANAPSRRVVLIDLGLATAIYRRGVEEQRGMLGWMQVLCCSVQQGIIIWDLNSQPVSPANCPSYGRHRGQV